MLQLAALMLTAAVAFPDPRETVWREAHVEYLRCRGAHANASTTLYVGVECAELYHKADRLRRAFEESKDPWPGSRSLAEQRKAFEERNRPKPRDGVP